MSKKRKRRPVFKDYHQHQMSLLPPSWDELIPSNHAVRLVNQIIDQVDLDFLFGRYHIRGASSFHPQMMLKILVYAYLSNIYSSRKIEAAVQQNIHFMWLAGGSQPDHNTINRFRSEKLKGILKKIFSQVVILMVDQGLVSMDKVYLDGTKIEANANRYSFVWGKTTKKNKQKLLSQLEELWAYTQQVAKEEMSDNEPTTFHEVDAAIVQQTVNQIDQLLQGKDVDPKIKKKLSRAKKHWPQKMEEYEQKEQVLGERNSYSKTDPDATFMRMKDDHFKNGQLKPAYNWQISTSDQYILNYSVHPDLADTVTLPNHMDEYESLYGQKPDELCADAGYGSEENYEYLEDNEIEAYVKYNTFHQEQKKKYREDPFRVDNLYYNAEQDYYVCPMGQHMEKIGTTQQETTTGYVRHYSVYQAKNCDGCPLRGLCHNSQYARRIEVNHNLIQHKLRVRKLLDSEKGNAHRKQRGVDVEAVFGNIKHNKNFNRFMLRGKQKVLIEIGLLSLAHNLAKMAKN